jgi:hypothetical protein
MSPLRRPNADEPDARQHDAADAHSAEHVALFIELTPRRVDARAAGGLGPAAE